MNDQPVASNQGKISPPSTSVAKTEPINAIPTEPATADQLSKVEKEMTGFERATLRWAKLAVFMSAVAAFFVCAQWYEMHQGGIDTHDLAVAAKKQADKAETISASLQSAVSSLQAANSQAEESFKETVKEAELGQRAWVEVEVIPSYKAEANGNSLLEVQLIATNRGHTPAIGLNNWFVQDVCSQLKSVCPPTLEQLKLRLSGVRERLKLVNRELSTKEPFLLGSIADTSSTLAPSASKSQTVLRVSFTPEDIDRMSRSLDYRYLFHAIPYRDVFGAEHKTSVCVMYRVPANARECPGRSEMN